MQPTSSIVGTDGAVGVVSPAVAAWWALRVASNRERTVTSALERSRLRAFLPVYSARARWSDRTKTVERLLFPGYVFVSAPAAELPAVSALGGVVGVLPSNLRPVAITESEIENVKRAITSLRPLEASEYVAGDPVTIQGGALKGVSGVIVRSKGALRLVVRVEMLNRAVAVELEAADLARAAA